MVFWIILICTFQISGCSDANKSSDRALERKTNSRGNIVMTSEQPSLSIVDVDDDHYGLLISDRGKNRTEFRLEKNGGKLPKIADSFFSNYCRNKVLIVVLAADASTGITYGRVYENLVIAISLDKILNDFIAGEVFDKETNEVISNNQKQTIAKLKSGVQSADECQKMDEK